MLPLPFSISPLLLSIFVIYPWALALGVWQVGKLTGRPQRVAQQTVRDADLDLAADERFLPEHGIDHGPWTAAALQPSPLNEVPDLVIVGALPLPADRCATASPAVTHRTPRAPPAAL